MNRNYENMIESDWMESGDNVIVFLYKRNGFKSIFCHQSQLHKYKVFGSSTMCDLYKTIHDLNNGIIPVLQTKEEETYYIIEGFIDLNKFKLIPIKNKEINENIIPDTKYIITTGNNKFEELLSNENKSFTCRGIKGFLPILPTKVVNAVFTKHNKIKRKLEKMYKDFEDVKKNR